MKKSLLVLSLAAVFFASCGDKKKEEEVKVEETVVEAAKEVAQDVVGDVELGKKLFTDKTCATCHMPDTKVIGPSIKDIHKVYAEQNAEIITFLKGETPAIVDTDPGQVAIMKANLDGFVKDLTAEELASIVAYMKSVN